MKILDVMWFGNVGIARVDSFGEIKYYIKEVDGLDEEHDKQDIANWGCSFSKDAGDMLFRKTPCLMYEGKVIFGDKESLDFVSKLIHHHEANADRRSAQMKG